MKPRTSPQAPANGMAAANDCHKQALIKSVKNISYIQE
jgi:hypothetical protein